MSGYLRKMARRHMRVNDGVRNRLAREHEDVLQSIETVFVNAYRRIDAIDDRLCHQAVESVLMGSAPSDPLAALLADQLAKVRRFRDDVPDRTWQDALRVVARSIRDHSERQPGQVEYLAFIDAFIA